ERRPGLPTIILVTFRCLAKSTISSATFRPTKVTVSAPSRPANLMLSAARLRSASGSIAILGCSTYTADHFAWRLVAILLAAPITWAEEGLRLHPHTRWLSLGF